MRQTFAPAMLSVSVFIGVFLFTLKLKAVANSCQYLTGAGHNSCLLHSGSRGLSVLMPYFAFLEFWSPL